MKTRHLIISLFTLLPATLQAQALQAPMQLWYDRPAQYFEESLPIGNGKLGALVYGGAEDCLIYLNDITFWTGKPVDQNEGTGVAEWIPKIREALFNDDYQRADSLQLHVEGHNSQFYQPLATMHIYDWNEGKVKKYRRQLDIDSAICNDRYVRNGIEYRREYLASHPDRLIAIRLTASKKGALNFRVAMSAQVPAKTKASGNGQLTLTGHATGDPQQSIHFCAITRIAETDGTLTADNEGITLQHATHATIYFINETSYNGARRHPVDEAAPYLDRATEDIWHTSNVSYDSVRRQHISDYQHYYNRVKLDLGANTPKQPTDQLLKQQTNNRYLETLYFQYGRYLLISSSRTAGVPANLQGLWTPHLWSPWRGNYTVNINLEENYWPAFVSNLAEMAMPLDQFITALADNGQHTARNFYGVGRGWCAGHNSDLWAMTNPVGENNESPMWSCWNMGGAWLVNTLWERYLYTQDTKYLQQTAYPLMRGAAEFCLDWLIENPKHKGELITAPSTSPENEYITDKGYHGVTCYGGTADLAIIRELLLNTRQAAATLKTDKKLADNINQAIQQLHPYTIGQHGDLNEWYYDWDDKDKHHRHQSHLIGLYPGQHMLKLKEHNALLKACEQTLVQKGNETTGWSTGWRINLWARLKNAENAYAMYRKLLTYVTPEHYNGADRRHGGGTYANLLDAHPPFQIDGNFGGTAGVCEMLLQSHCTTSNGKTTIPVVELLPALPAAWSDGHVSGLCARGGYEFAMTWRHHQLTAVAVTAKKGGTVVLSHGNQKKTIRLRAGQTQQLQPW